MTAPPTSAGAPASAVRGPGSEQLLADGRTLRYYDDEGGSGAGRERPDERPLTAADRGRAGEVRQDPLTGDWVAVAAHRMTRTFLPPAGQCPLCPSGSAGSSGAPSEVPAADYDVVVLDNRFPSFSAGAVGPEPGSLLDGEELWPVGPAGGRTEVVCFSADHDASFGDLGVERLRTVVRALAHRTEELSALPDVAQVFCFENRGEEIGVTLSHPHGQVYAYPYLPPRTQALLARARAHRAAGGGNLLADVLAAEKRAGTRVVLEAEHWTAYVPAAARWPVEVHLAPHRDVPDLAALEDDEREELAHVQLDLVQRLDRFFDEVEHLPYISGWHQAPTGEGRDLGRLHLQAFSLLRSPGRLKYLAGSESGMAAWVSDRTPEAIAERLREVAR
ncbi:galactose-1-phosphate uridylyltransferase [uncultured Pseudokineococcus sp.]|uniref:galactose-1-phosphate uridylyltransferase n=1 Tax=uncultured Pseudokineococcus sp. TaxID=1642928 RepID=UPI002614B4C4|nr:galactose-1-phosphate uridylyltransferase [uncultured Pseudokineococcus sp.]